LRVLGTLKEPIMVKSYGDEQYVGCTGSPADSHVTIWLTVSFGIWLVEKYKADSFM
jgi:hypothetical protein